MTFLAIKLFMGRALERLLSLFKLALAHPWQSACIGLACVSVWLWRADSRHIAERDAARATIAALIKASDEAKAKQIAQDRANIGVQTERNKEVTHDLAIVEAARRDAVRDYAAANRCVMRPKGDQRPAIPAGVHPDPQGAAIAGPVADMVAVTPQDLDSLAESAVRGASCAGFLNTLVDEGLAVAD